MCYYDLHFAPRADDSVMFLYRDTFYVERNITGASVMNLDNYKEGKEIIMFGGVEYTKTFYVTEAYIKSLPVSNVEPVFD